MEKCVKTAWFLVLTSFSCTATALGEPPQTVAETSNFTATSSYADVVRFCDELAKQSPIVRLGELGTSQQGRKLPLLILADPPVETPEEAARSKKLVVLIIANIHAGEVDGKEGLLMLARELALASDRPLLKDLILVCAPIFNADGNEQMAKNRPSQAGPELVGIRANAQGLDLNRDFVKLATPEVQSLVRAFNVWQPAVFMDLHTTNGSYHRYTLTYEGGRSPAGDPKVVEYVRDVLLPDAGQRLQKATSYRSYFYGNFTPDRRTWSTVPPTPRYGIHYFGLRGGLGVLSESYSYAQFKNRVLASKEFTRAVCSHVAANKEKIQALVREARNAERGNTDKLVLRQKSAPLGRPVQIPGYVEEMRDGRRVRTDELKEYEVFYDGGVEPTLTVTQPFAYAFPADWKDVVANLEKHGIQVDRLAKSTTLEVETYRIDKITKGNPFQQRQPTTLEATPRSDKTELPAGTLVVPTAEPLGSLAAFLLEPMASDGLATWNFFDMALAEGKDFPVLRIVKKQPLETDKPQ